MVYFLFFSFPDSDMLHSKLLLGQLQARPSVMSRCMIHGPARVEAATNVYTTPFRSTWAINSLNGWMAGEPSSFPTAPDTHPQLPPTISALCQGTSPDILATSATWSSLALSFSLTRLLHRDHSIAQARSCYWNLRKHLHTPTRKSPHCVWAIYQLKTNTAQNFISQFASNVDIEPLEIHW
jgi:hypothetical protein